MFNIIVKSGNNLNLNKMNYFVFNYKLLLVN